ncbi:MAG: LysE family translocator [Pseudomonadota bacterium]
MDPVLLFGFVSITLLFVATPGPSVALAASQAVRFGPRAAVTTVAGDAIGTVVHIVIAGASLQTLIALSEVFLPYLQIAGGVFILYLALQALLDAGKPLADISVKSGRATFLTGFFACVSNPKAIVFFVALFPGFISPDHSIFVQTMVYGAIFLVLDAASILGYALLAMHTFRRTAARFFRVEYLSGLGLFGVDALLIGKGYRSLPSQ